MDMLARWNPWQDLFDIQREMDELGRRVFGSGGLAPVGRRPNGNVWAPAVDVFSRGEDLVVQAELPGVDPDRDIEISLQDGMLTIRGERRHEDRVEKDDYYRFESTYGSFQRSIPLPQGVREDDIRANYENGILEVVVPKARELAEAKKIPVEVGDRRKALTARARKK
jgi:HSP20 family protein